jgi:putative hemolysin
MRCSLWRERKHVSGQSRYTDYDKYDSFCDHLIIMDKDNNSVVGAYRMMLGCKVSETVGFYSEQMFDLSNIKKLDGQMLELGRTCIRKDYRNSNVLNLLWQGIAQYIRDNNVRYLFGCSSLVSRGPDEIREIFSYLREKCYSQEKFRVYPRDEYRFNGILETYSCASNNTFRKLPVLLQGYLKTGAKVCGYPAVSFEFRDTVLLFVLLDISQMAASYRQRFFKHKLHI